MTTTKSTTSIDKVRVLVLGDSGVGKTSVIQLICNEVVNHNPPSTIGCYTDVKLFDYNDKPYFVEFLEVGGKMKYETTRNMFYSHVNGLLLVHDVTNKNSFNNLKRWISEYLARVGGNESLRWKGDEETTETDYLELQIPNSSATLPVLIIGNKSDLAPKDPKRHVSNFVEENGSANIEVSAWDPLSFAPGTNVNDKLSSFYTKMIFRAFYDHHRRNSINSNDKLTSPRGSMEALSRGRTKNWRGSVLDEVAVDLDSKND